MLMPPLTADSAVSVFALHPQYMRIDAVTKDPTILKEVAEKREVLNKLPQVDYEVCGVIAAIACQLLICSLGSDEGKDGFIAPHL